MSKFPNEPAIQDNKTNLASQTVNGLAPLLTSRDVDMIAALKARNGKDAETSYKNAELKAEHRDKKATIKDEKGNKNLADVVAKTDPKGTGQIAPEMYKYLNKIFSSMSAGGGSASKGGAKPKAEVKSVIEDAFTGALSILSNKYTFDYLIEMFDKIFADNGINLIDKEYRKTVKNAIANLFTNYTLYGPNNMPYFTPSAYVGEIGPAPSPVVTIVPELYIQEYYYPSEDPYPGYIKWVLNQDDEDAEEIAVYTQRKIGDVYYTSADEEIYSIAEKELAEALDPYIETLTLTAKILNELLSNQNDNIEKNKKEKSSGKGSSNNLLSILKKLAGYAGANTDKQLSVQLPTSVLNQSSIIQSQKNFLENIAKLKEMKKHAKKASRTRESSDRAPPDGIPQTPAAARVASLTFSSKW